MVWQSTPYTVPLLFTAAVGLSFAAIAGNRLLAGTRTRSTPALVAVAGAASLYAGAYGLQLAAVGLAEKLFWARVTWVGIVGLAVAWPTFVLVYAAGERTPDRRLLAAVAAPGAIAGAAAWLHLPLLYTSVGLDASGGFVRLAATPGALLVAFLVYTYALDVAALVVLVREIRRATGVVRRQAALLFVAGVVPLLGSLLTVTGRSPLGTVDLTPLLLALTTPLIGWAVFRYRLLDLVPLVYDRVFEELGDGVVVVDGDRRIVSLGGAASRLVDGDATVGDRVADAFPDRPGLLDALNGKEEPLELFVEAAEGHRRYEATVSPLDVSGAQPGQLVVLHDVTERRRAERRFRALIEKSTTTISVLDEEGRIRYASPSHERLLGYEPGSLTNGSALDLIHPTDEQRVAARFREVLRGADVGRVEFRIRHADGSWRTFEGAMDDRLDDPDVDGVVLSCHDVTERRGHEQRLQVLNRVLRHDVRNDVNVIDGYVELLADRHDDPTTASYVDVIRGKTADLVALSNKARRIDEALTRGGERSPIDLAALLRHRVRALRREHPRAVVEADLPDAVRVLADPLVGSVVDNVLENAVEHNDDPTPSVTLTLTRGDRGGEPTAELRVADDGPPIPPADRRVLESGEETQLEHASGLGLWLINWLVTGSGGELELRENEPRGNVVVVRLPLADGAPSTDRARGVDGAAAPSDGSKESE